jgi:hypothetical protein
MCWHTVLDAYPTPLRRLHHVFYEHFLRSTVLPHRTGIVHFWELVGRGEIPTFEMAPDREEAETRLGWLPRWLKGLLRQRERRWAEQE